MSKSRPTSVVTTQGTCPANSASTPCCLARSGTHEITGHFGRIFRQYGRSTSWFASASVAAAALPAGVTWENYYYADSYAYQLVYRVTAASTGTISVVLRANATVHSTPPTLLAAAPTLFTTVTAATITTAMTNWNAAIQAHWTGKYTVQLGAPDCPGTFPMSFSVVQASGAGNAHVSFTVLDMQHPRTIPAWAAALGNPASPSFATAQALANEWRSDAGKFNLGDTRGTLVFAHEYGHWMGWGDEYIEVSGSTPNPSPPPAGAVAMETRGGANVSLRVAVRIVNPTQVYQSAAGSSQEDIDITVAARSNWLMADMQSAQTYPKRYVFTIVDDFIRVYNQDHYGGAATAFCINVT